MSKIKVGVVGIGRIGALLEEDKLRQKPCTHLGAYMAVPECEVVAIADRDQDRAYLVASKWGISNVFADGREMVQKCPIDLVSVCTPTETHFNVAMDVAPHVKAIFCEKPITHNIETAKKLVKTCEELGVTLAVNHTRRYCNSYQKVKAIIDSEEYGELVHILGYASREKDFEGNIHMFDLLNWFSNHNPKTYIDCYPVDYMIFEVDIILSDGRIKILNNGREINVYKKEKTKFFSKGEFIVNELKLAGRVPPYSFSQAMIHAVEDLVSCIQKDAQPKCKGEDGLKALELALSHKEGWK